MAVSASTKARVLCTGGMGYIGSHTIVQLLKAGYDCAILDNLSNSNPIVLERLKTITGVDVPFFKADCCDAEAMEKLFSTEHFDCVIHFAGFKAVGESVEKPLMYYYDNITGTINLMQAMVNNNCKRVVFSSSATVYQPQERPLVETDALGPINPYGQTKLMTEQIMEDVCVADKETKVELLRYFNPVGAHPSGLIGESPNGRPNNLMPYVQQVAVGRRPCVNVFGNDYDTPDGTGVRDYIHVMDLADAHVKAVTYLLRDDIHGTHIHNLGTGRGASVLEMIHGLEEASGKKIPYKIVARRPGDLGSVICNPALAEKELGWVATRDMKTVMEDSWRWQSENPYGYDKEAPKEEAE
ncbi:UDP-glucose 4-epimerase, putative [Perkinsus marinus ATCC 50983]|uniref:UDP-glucose 4-epimerase n=1 Tax=Perkinsus marinus (strain ATCC 50983 / TXsc) TaxID=423536 RepID=C5LMJ8_PERM5|nr:UDP-glucose 4-epimerase, putative [Perkinsus marinus ATCC 50983]EER02015.1 UDP-glucose 4-epimerase, putative [Perkinsus marinus ATCC 50983]|eukprot:XP_002769297.1 UDP-glucose 4-epimerase, putative [Perkinsus marinus ATCC 50983]